MGIVISTKRPTGLTTSRRNLTFTFTWKIADKDYRAGQQFQWRTNHTGEGKWNSVAVGIATTSVSITIPASDFYPNQENRLKTVMFRVMGRRREYSETRGQETTTYTPDWSEWSMKTYTILEPDRPTLEVERTSANTSVFSWDVDNRDKSNKILSHVQYQSIRVKENKETDGSKLKWTSSNAGWRTGTGSAEDSQTFEEDTSLLANASWTRWVRVRARGPRNPSEWRYAKHVYAEPYKAQITSATAKVSSGATIIAAKWTAASNAAHPIDSSTVEYLIATPGTGRSVPAGASWTDGNVSDDTAGKDAAKVTIGTVLDVDQCLWVRVVTKHDDNVTYSSPVLVQSGKLTVPSGLSVVTDTTTYRATVTATNNSSVPDSKLAVTFSKEGWAKPLVLGIIPHGETSVDVQCPSWTNNSGIAFGVYAFQGTTERVLKNDLYRYEVSANMQSKTIDDGGDVPSAPTNVRVTKSETEGEVIIRWGWAWRKADSAEISWSDNPNAWESTSQPQTYMVDNINAAKWRVSGLEPGKKWYFRVRLAIATDDGYTYGPYSSVSTEVGGFESEASEVDLSSPPVMPVLTLSESVAPRKATVTAAWAYVSTDTTNQIYAEICQATINGSTITYGKPFAHTETAQHIDFKLTGSRWVTGETYNLCVRVTSGSGQVSEWSEPVPLQVADPVVCEIVQTSLTDETTDFILESLPLTATATGAGTGGVTTLVIERAAEYHMDRPDETETDGYEGETVALIRVDGEGQITVNQSDLIGKLDDGAAYRLLMTAQDGLGQTDTEEMEFTVRWAHQAIIPEATAEADGLIVKIMPTAETVTEGDVCDIYRLSADRPELIVQNGTFGTTYVDPYPAIGERYGHRVVYKTVNGDYITADNMPAWTDVYTGITEYSIIIDFDGRQLILPYNITLANSWAKDFQVTNYLGGSQQGDWNPTVSRTATYNLVLTEDDDATIIDGMRYLADYHGICHVRTPEGSSFAADVQVSENNTYRDGIIASYTLTVTRVDPERLDGMTLEEWLNGLE